MFVDTRSDRTRIYVTDRGNARLQVYAADGRFLRAVDEGLRSPSALVAVGGELVVAELHARLAVLDGDDRLVGYLGRDDEAPERPGWPNAFDAEGRTVRPAELRPGRFNSPHGLAADAGGGLYVAEWLIGGRITRLRGGARGRLSPDRDVSKRSFGSLVLMTKWSFGNESRRKPCR